MKKHKFKHQRFENMTAKTQAVKRRSYTKMILLYQVASKPNSIKHIHDYQLFSVLVTHKKYLEDTEFVADDV